MRHVRLLAVLLLCAASAGAQGFVDSADVVGVAAEPDTLRAAVGSRVEFAVRIEVAEGWHLYANGDPRFYGISLTGLDSLPLAYVEVGYPAGRAGKFLGETVTLLEGSETVTVSGWLTAEPAAPLSLELECQACDDGSCLAPAWLPVSVVVLPEE